VKLAGYAFARLKASEGIHDPLKAQVLLLQEGNKKICIISMDMMSIEINFTERLRNAINLRTGIPQHQIMVVCSHIHSGPQGFNTDIAVLHDARDESLLEITLCNIVGACCSCLTNLQPVRFSTGTDWGYGIGLNRNDPEHGEVDQQVTVVRIDDVKGIPLVLFFNYGCHPTVIGADNFLISADFPGAARRCLANVYPGTISIFTNGAAGDVSTRFTRRNSSYEEVDRFGQILAAAVVRAANSAECFSPDTITCNTISLEVPPKQFPSIDEMRNKITSLSRKLEHAKNAPESQGELRKLITKLEGAKLLLQQAEIYKEIKKIIIEIQQIKIGNYSLIGIPGEPYSKTIKDIKNAVKPAPIILMGYANDYLGYFPESSDELTDTYEDYVSLFSTTAALKIKETIIKMIKESNSNG
jgi:hypothetical protein